MLECAWTESERQTDRRTDGQTDRKESSERGTAKEAAWRHEKKTVFESKKKRKKR